MKIDELEKAVTNLRPEELHAFSTWFDAFREGAWDREIERDASAGKLDAFVARAREEHRAGRTKPL
jgi:hypothetical protein